MNQDVSSRKYRNERDEIKFSLEKKHMRKMLVVCMDKSAKTFNVKNSEGIRW